MRSHTVLSVGVLMATMAASSCSGSGDNAPQQATVHNVYVTHPQSAGVSLSKDYAALVQETRSIGAGFKTGGQIVRVHADEGDYVRKGQLLAELDNADYALAVKESEVRYNQKKAEMARKEKLHANKNLSENDYEASLAELQQIKAKLDMDGNKLAYTRLYAPSSGYVVKREHEQGESVNAGTPVFQLMDNSALEVVVDIPVSEFVNRDNFSSFTGHTSLAPNERFELKMLSLTPRADNNQLYQLKLAAPAGSKASLTPGMNLTVTINQREGSANPVMTVPARAVFQKDGKSFVWAVDMADSTVKAKPVETTTQVDADGMMRIASGLDGTETLVRAGVHVLAPGEKVAILPESSSTNPGNLL